MPTAVRPRLPRWIIPTAAPAVLLLAGLAAWGLRALRDHPAPAPRVQPRRTVVVLPFENPGGNPDTAYFAEAMTDEILTQVSRLHNLSLLARLRRDIRDPLDAARQLGGDLLLQGSAGRSRVSASLIDIATGAPVWSVSDVRPPSPTSSPEDYDNYLRGRFHLTAGSYDLALQMLAKAVELDPAYPLAQAWLAQALALHYRYVRSDPARLDQAVATAERAFRLGPSLPEAHLALATLRACQGNWNEALDHARESLELRPNDPWTQVTLSWIYTYHESLDPDRIREHAEEALRFAPELGLAYVQLARSLLLASHPSEADAALQRAVLLMPDSFLPHLGRAELHLSLGKHLQAQQALEVALALAPDGPLPVFYQACLEAVQGRTEEALTAWERAVAKGFHDWDLARRIPYLDTLRAEERFYQRLPAGEC